MSKRRGKSAGMAAQKKKGNVPKPTTPPPTESVGRGRLTSRKAPVSPLNQQELDHARKVVSGDPPSSRRSAIHLQVTSHDMDDTDQTAGGKPVPKSKSVGLSRPGRSVTSKVTKKPATPSRASTKKTVCKRPVEADASPPPSDESDTEEVAPVSKKAKIQKGTHVTEEYVPTSKKKSTAVHINEPTSSHDLVESDEDNRNEEESPQQQSQVKNLGQISVRYVQDTDSSVKTPKKSVGSIRSKPPSTPGSTRKYFKDPKVLERLCELWEATPYLYDQTEPLYKDPAAKWAAISDFGDELGIPAHFVSVRMTSLRSDYQKIVNGKIKSGCSAAEGALPYKKDLIKRMCSFLYHHVKKEPSVSSYDSNKRNVQTYAVAQIERMKLKRKQEGQTDEQEEEEADLVEEEDVVESDDTESISEEVDLSAVSRVLTRSSPKIALNRQSTEKYEVATNVGSKSQSKGSARRSLDMDNLPQQKSNLVSSGPKGASVVSNKGKCSPAAGPSKGRGRPKKVVKEQDQVHFNLDYLDDQDKFQKTQDPDVSGDYESLRKGGKRNIDSKKKTVADVLEGREKYYQSVADSMKNLTHTTAPPAKPQAVDDSQEKLFGQLIVLQMAKMPQEVKDQFMVHVHSLAVKANRGEWPLNV